MINHLATLITQIIVYYLPIEDISIKISCTVVFSAIIIIILNKIKDMILKIINKFYSLRDNYVIVNNTNDTYHHLMKYLYEKYYDKTTGCILSGDDIIIDRIENNVFVDNFKNQIINIKFGNQESTSISPNNDKKNNVVEKNVVISSTCSVKIIEEYIQDILKKINYNNNDTINVYKIEFKSKGKKNELVWIKSKLFTNKTIQNTIVSRNVKKLFFDDIAEFINKHEY